MSRAAPVDVPNAELVRRRVLRFGLVVLVTILAVWGVQQYRERHLRQAEDALSRGDVQHAYQLVTTFLSERPGHASAKALLARTFVAMGESQPAIQLFDEVGAATTEELQSLGRAYLMQERWSEALPVLSQAIELDPNNADALYEFTSASLRLGLSDAALQSATRFAALPGHEARGWVFVGSIHGDRGNYEQAAAAYLRVLDYSPEAKGLQVRADELLLELGRMLMGNGQPAEAVGYIQRSIDLLPSDDGFVSLGQAKAELGDLDAAVKAWSRAVAISPSNLEAREYLANERLQKSDAEAALKWLQPLESSPSLRAGTAYALQRCYTLLEQPEKAEQWREKTAALRKREKLATTIENLLMEDPHSFWSLVIRAHRFASSGNWEQAELVLNGLKSDSDDAFVTDLITAVRNRSRLPSLERLPITQF